MEEIAKVFDSFDDEKRKKLFTDLGSATTVEGIMDIGKNYDLNMSKDLATRLHEGLNDASKLSKEELSETVGGLLYCHMHPQNGDIVGCTVL